MAGKRASRAGRWVTNEKGLVPAVALLPQAPTGFSERAAAVMSAVGADPDSLYASVELARELVQETELWVNTGLSSSG